MGDPKEPHKESGWIVENAIQERRSLTGTFSFDGLFHILINGGNDSSEISSRGCHTVFQFKNGFLDRLL